ncbi:MAG: hypothetical protein V3V49_13120, partial [Candidatus Krumholzibacteria bacterium]
MGRNTTDDFKSGTPILTISNGTASFSIAQTNAQVGVGSELTYGGGAKCYIKKKNSDTQWQVTTAAGGVPADVSGATVEAIRHAFGSLAAAEAGAADAAHLGTADLVAADLELHIACYNHLGTADTAPVVVAGWNSDASRFIRIFTPTDTATECNASQRHDGTAGSGDRLAPTGDPGTAIVQVSEPFVTREGLEIRMPALGSTSDEGVRFDFNQAGATGTLRACIIWSEDTTADQDAIYQGLSSGDITVENCIIFNWSRSGVHLQAYTTSVFSQHWSVLNCTIHGNGAAGEDESAAIQIRYGNAASDINVNVVNTIGMGTK